LQVKALNDHESRVRVSRYFAVSILCWTMETMVLLILYGGFNLHFYASIPLFGIKIDFSLLLFDGLSTIFAFGLGYYLNKRWTFKEFIRRTPIQKGEEQI